MKFLALSLFLLFSLSSLQAQTLPDFIVKKINTLFSHWHNPESPGCAIGIISNDSLIFSKGYGMANLEYSIPNSAQTDFHLASISKQFTAFAILLLANEGKLQLGDDIRKHLPWFPDLKKKITILHLLNHTSGVRDQWQLLSISGTRLEDVITQDQIIKILGKQNALNFSPGDRFVYSNSGYTMLAEIVKSVSGKSLRKYADSAIFKPLGMSHTYFYDDNTEIVKNKAYSYDRKEGDRFANHPLNYATVGATSLHSNVDDLSKWLNNFYNIKVGNETTITQLTLNAKLNDGTQVPYAAGVISETYKGWKQYWHNGSDAGYRTFILVLPELKKGVIVLSNLGEIDARGKAIAIAELLVTDKSKEDKDKPLRSVKVPGSEMDFIKSAVGNYISDDGMMQMTLNLRNDSLFQKVEKNEYLMARESKNIYSMFYAPDYKLMISPNAGNKNLQIVTPYETYRFGTKLVKPELDLASLKAITGIYYCPELNCSYGIELRGSELFLINNKYNDLKLSSIGSDRFLNDNWFMKQLVMTRDRSGKIDGFEVNSGRVLHLKFDKISNVK